MRDTLSTAQLVQALGISLSRFRTLQNRGRGDLALLATHGSGTGRAAWSLTDGLRLAVVERLDSRHALAPEGRRAVWDALSPSTALTLLAGGGPRLIVSDGFGFALVDSLAEILDMGAEDDDWASQAPTIDPSEALDVLDLHRVARTFAERARRVLLGETLPPVDDDDEDDDEDRP